MKHSCILAGILLVNTASFAGELSDVDPSAPIANVYPGCQIAFQTSATLEPGKHGSLLSTTPHFLWGRTTSGSHHDVYAYIAVDLINTSSGDVTINAGENLVIKRVRRSRKITNLTYNDSELIPNKVFTCDQENYCTVFEMDAQLPSGKEVKLQGFVIVDKHPIVSGTFTIESIGRYPLNYFASNLPYKFQCPKE